MSNIQMFNSDNMHIKHMSPIKFRKLKKMIKQLAINPIPKEAEVFIELFYYDGTELYADLWASDKGKLMYKETIQTFEG